jgi:hypothetical protein
MWPQVTDKTPVDRKSGLVFHLNELCNESLYSITIYIVHNLQNSRSEETQYAICNTRDDKRHPNAITAHRALQARSATPRTATQHAAIRHSQNSCYKLLATSCCNNTLLQQHVAATTRCCKPNKGTRPSDSPHPPLHPNLLPSSPPPLPPASRLRLLPRSHRPVNLATPAP